LDARGGVRNVLEEERGQLKNDLMVLKVGGA